MSKKISQFPPLYELTGDEEVPILHNGVNYKINASLLTQSSGSGLLTLNAVSSNYTLRRTDAVNTLIRVTGSQAIYITIPNDGNELPMPIGSSVIISRNGLGAVMIRGEVGVTIDSPDSYTLSRRFSKIVAIKVGANHWEIEGGLAAV